MIPAALLSAFDESPLPGAEDPIFKNRYDTKFLFPASQLEIILEHLCADYLISCYENWRIQEYESIYFDDPGLGFYRDHQRGKLRRFKVRMRFYPSSGYACLEIKMKTNRLTTLKWRRAVPRGQFEAGLLTADDSRFMGRTLQAQHGSLLPTVYVRYTRLALQHKKSAERVTLDMGLTYVDAVTGAARPAGDFIVAEVKQARSSSISPFRRLMRELRIPQASFSKYCYGIYLLHPEVRHNRLKQKYLALERKKRMWRAFQPMPAGLGVSSARKEERHVFPT